MVYSSSLPTSLNHFNPLFKHSPHCVDMRFSLCYRLCGQLRKVPYPQPLFSAVVTEERGTASEGKVELLTVPLSGRNGRFFLAKISNPFGSCPVSLY